MFETALVELKLGEQRTIVLQGRGSAGYGWFATVDDAAVAGVTKSGTIPPVGSALGRSSSSLEVFTVTGRAAGETRVHFALVRPWEPGKPIATREFRIVVRP